MTTNTTTASRTSASERRPAVRASIPPLGPERGPGIGRLVASEWTKLWSLRSTWWTLAVTVAVSLGFAVAVAAATGGAAGDPSVEELQLGTDDAALILAGTGLAALVLGVLGALQMSGEYASGTMSVSLTAAPRRLPLLAAKAAVLVAVVAPVSLAVSAASLLLGDVMIDGGLDFSWPAVLGNTAYFTTVALLGLGLATAVRSTAMAMTLLVAIVFIVPPLLPLLPWGWVETAADYTPGAAGESLFSRVSDTVPLGDAAAIWTLVAWSVVPLVAGGVLLARRDA